MTYTQLWTAKYITDGATSIDQIIAMLEGQIQLLREQQAAGVTLANPVDGGHAVLVTDNPQTASTFGFEADDDDDDNAPVPKKAAPQRQSRASRRKPHAHPMRRGSSPRKRNR